MCPRFRAIYPYRWVNPCKGASVGQHNTKSQTSDDNSDQKYDLPSHCDNGAHACCLVEELHLTLLRGAGSKDLPITSANLRGDPLRRDHLFTKGNKLSHQVSLPVNLVGKQLSSVENTLTHSVFPPLTAPPVVDLLTIRP